MASNTSFATFGRDLQLATAGLSPEAIAPELAKFARAELQKAIASGRASTSYDRYVNNTPGLPEDAVKLPGHIFYEFSYWGDVISHALTYLAKRSPRLSGQYIGSQAVMVDGQVIAPTAQIRADQVVTIVPTVPYSRKIEVGHMKMRAERYVMDAARREMDRRFRGVVQTSVQWITLPDGYTLKGHFRRGHRPGARNKGRADVAAGQRMTYPALILRMV